MAAERIFVALGANLGDPQDTLRRAMRDIAAMPQTLVVARSSLWRTAPVDACGPDFLNAVVELRSELAPQALLEALQGIEHQHGRERPYRHAPRSLDLDLLLYGDRVLDTAMLTLPHPRAHLRSFVLQPLAEIDPALLLRGHGPVAALAAGITDQVVQKLR